MNNSTLEHYALRGIFLRQDQATELDRLARKHSQRNEVPYEKQLEMIRDLEEDQTNMEIIIQAVNDVLHISRSALLGRIRTGTLAEARHTAYYLAQGLFGMPHARIGALCGWRDHTTVRHGINKIKNYIETYPAFKAKVDMVASRIGELRAEKSHNQLQQETA